MADHAPERRHRRYDTPDLRGSCSHSVEATVQNISLAGMAVQSHHQLSIGRSYVFRIREQQEQVLLTGTVKWCHLARTERGEGEDFTPVYAAGIAFDDILNEKAEELMLFMRKNVVVDLADRFFGRFTLEGEDPVTLKAKYSFLVKQLSLSGMLIRAEVPFQPETELGISVRLNGDFFASQARIVNLREVTASDGTAIFQMGLEFIEPERPQLENLERFIQKELDSAA